ncbi:hypothetical protein H696_05816 [Fonticula alba]|uniref:Uncharacterized protein n=1 Tax=Fonticula alba TaxID=691883 RepID=A0A058Z189_FONAL|nr:hypothetical protein H696_05816 [Fonticula alba]KCV67708.1 hypothetical protein H696_05816 [Fonticula alba]|eukprot:XP_009497892.1 hypothetical protein H696_05816 [Fonticula alba]
MVGPHQPPPPAAAPLPAAYPYGAYYPPAAGTPGAWWTPPGAGVMDPAAMAAATTRPPPAPMALSATSQYGIPPGGPASTPAPAPGLEPLPPVSSAPRPGPGPGPMAATPPGSGYAPVSSGSATTRSNSPDPSAAAAAAAAAATATTAAPLPDFPLGKSLSQNNNELIQCIVHLRQKRDILHAQILEEDALRMQIDQELRNVAARLEALTSSLEKKRARQGALDQAIAEAEDAYSKLVQSSQVLLNYVKRESQGGPSAGDSG